MKCEVLLLLKEMTNMLKCLKTHLHLCTTHCVAVQYRESMVLYFVL